MSNQKFILSWFEHEKQFNNPFNIELQMWHCTVKLPFYYIPITDTTLELSVFWPSDTESRISELRFYESISLSFKTRLTSVTCFCGDVT